MMRSLTVGFVFALVLGSAAHGANVGIIPTKLIVVDKLTAAGKAKTVYVSKDQAAGITKGASTDPSQISVRFDVVYGNGSAAGAFTLPAGTSNGTDGWLVNKTTVAKYVNKAAPSGPTQVKVAVVKPGKLLKLIGKGLGDAPLDIFAVGDPGAGGLHTAYCVTNGGEETCHCSVFTGCAYKLITNDMGAKLVCKRGAADPACVAAPVSTTTTSTTSTSSTLCVPLSCGSEGANCGTIDDGCGNTIPCGSCTPPQFCGGGGIANQCGGFCVPLTCLSAGHQCGEWSNGCDGTIDCGTCPAGLSCTGVPGQCVADVTTSTTTVITTTTTAPGGCLSDTDCLPNGQICNGSTCAPCTDVLDDARCGLGAACVGGTCTVGACHSDGQCTAPNICVVTQCSCEDSFTCGGAICVDGVCAPCSSDQQCTDQLGPGHICADTGACIIG